MRSETCPLLRLGRIVEHYFFFLLASSLQWNCFASGLEKTTAIRLIAVRKISFSNFFIEGFIGALNWVPIMLRDASFSDNQCEIFQYGFA